MQTQLHSTASLKPMPLHPPRRPLEFREPSSHNTKLEKSELDTSIKRDVDTSLSTKDASSEELKEWFGRAVGETFFRQMLSEMRKSVGKPAYLHGGRGEEVFQGEMDQLVVEKLSKASSEQLAGPMFELFELQLNAPPMPAPSFVQAARDHAEEISNLPQR